ncbi:hypothetical protein Tco_0517658 [Tanacetum coccineum]
MAYPLPLDTAYRSSGTETEFLVFLFDFRAKKKFYLSSEQILLIFLPLLQEVLIRASRLKKVMANKGKKSSIETLMPNDKADYYFGITNITVNEKNAYEVKGKFLDDLHNKAFSGTNRKDAVEHIEYYLKIIDLMKLPNVDHDKHIIVVFLISLAEGTRRWFDRTKESITCWVDLTAKFFGKYYPPSRIEGNNTPVIIWDLANPRFEGWLAKKFVNYKTMDIFTKGALWDYWKIGSNEIEVSDNESFDLEECWSDKEETAEIFKIETNVFNYETPLCLAFNEFNYLLKVDPNLLTKDIMGFKTYKDYKDDWSTNGIKMSHGCTTSHGLIMEYEKNQHQSNIRASLSITRVNVLNGQPVVGEMMDTIIEETYPEPGV